MRIVKCLKTTVQFCALIWGNITIIFNTKVIMVDNQLTKGFLFVMCVERTTMQACSHGEL